MKRLWTRWIEFAVALFAAGGLHAGTLVQFSTSVGNLDVELFDDDKPVTVQNFLKLVRAGAYQNGFLHSCVPGVVVQGGGFSVANPASFNPFLNYLNNPNFGAITNEFSVGPRLTNRKGTLAMAKINGAPNSAMSQWFFNLANNGGAPYHFDTDNGGYTVFGEVVRGTDVLDYFNGLGLYNGIIDLTQIYGQNAALFSRLPVTYAGNATPRYVDLVYFQIAILTAQIKPTTRGVEISWNSVPGKQNQIEVSTNSPPVWKPLKSVSGTGAVLKYEDVRPPEALRFYRLRVDY